MSAKESKYFSAFLTAGIGLFCGVGSFFFTSSVSPDVARKVDALEKQINAIIEDKAETKQWKVDIKEDVNEIKQDLKLLLRNSK